MALLQSAADRRLLEGGINDICTGNVHESTDPEVSDTSTAFVKVSTRSAIDWID